MTVIDSLQAMLGLVNRDELQHLLLAVGLGWAAEDCFILATYIWRSEHLRSDEWRPHWPPSLAWSSIAAFFWIGSLLGVLAILTLFGEGPVPIYGSVLVLGVFLSLLSMLRAFAREEV